MVYKKTRKRNNKTRKKNTKKTKQKKRINKKKIQFGGELSDEIRENETQKLKDFLQTTPDNIPVCLFAFSHHSSYLKSNLPIVPEGFTLLNFINSGKSDIGTESSDEAMFSRAMEYGSKVQKAYQSGEIIDQYGCLTDNGLSLKQSLMELQKSTLSENYGFALNKYYKAHLYLKEYHSGETFNDVVLETPISDDGRLILFNGNTFIQIGYDFFDTLGEGKTFFIPDERNENVFIIFSLLMEKVKKMIDLLSPDFLKQHKTVFCHATCRTIPLMYRGSEELVKNVSKKSVFSDGKLLDSSLFCFLKEATDEQRLELLRLFEENNIEVLSDLYDRFSYELFNYWVSLDSNTRYDLIKELLKTRSLTIVGPNDYEYDDIGISFLTSFNELKHYFDDLGYDPEKHKIVYENYKLFDEISIFQVSHVSSEERRELYQNAKSEIRTLTEHRAWIDKPAQFTEKNELVIKIVPK